MGATILGTGGATFDVVTTIVELFVLRVGTCNSEVCEDEVIDTSGEDSLDNDIGVAGEGNCDSESVVECVCASDTVVVEDGTSDGLDIDVVDSIRDD
jgi:hypothetical protein